MQNKTTCSVTFYPRRIRAWLALQGITPEGLYKKLPFSARYWTYILKNERPPTDEALRALRKAVGEEGWRFITGKLNTLRCQPEQEAAA